MSSSLSFQVWWYPQAIASMVPGTWGYSTNICGMDHDINQDAFINDLTHCPGSNHHPEADNTQMSISSTVLCSRIVYQKVYSTFSYENVRASQLHLTGPKLNLRTVPSPTNFSSNVLHLREWDPVHLNQGCHSWHLPLLHSCISGPSAKPFIYVF